MNPSELRDLQRWVRPDLDVLAACSRFLAADEEHVIAGGGNTSIKCRFGRQSCLFVKRSGTSLRLIRPDDFVAMDATQLRSMLRRRFSRQWSVRERQYKDALIAARLQSALGQRPSVESAMHIATPHRCTFHLHTSLVNMITCCVRGEAVTRRLFGNQVRFLNYVFPGIKLAQQVAANVPGHRFKPQGHNETGQVYFLGNHGVIFTADEAETVFALIEQVTTTIRRYVHGLVAKHSNAAGLEVESGPPEQQCSDLCRQLVESCTAIKPESVVTALHVADGVVRAALSVPDAESTARAGPLTPDQVVYCGPAVLWLRKTPTTRQLRTALERHLGEYGDVPKIVLHPKTGLFAIGQSEAAARTTQLVYRDALSITEGARMLGGVKPLTKKRALAIHHWEVETFRRKVSAAEMGQIP